MFTFSPCLSCLLLQDRKAISLGGGEPAAAKEKLETVCLASVSFVMLIIKQDKQSPLVIWCVSVWSYHLTHLLRHN